MLSRDLLAKVNMDADLADHVEERKKNVSVLDPSDEQTRLMMLCNQQMDGSEMMEAQELSSSMRPV